jgi:3-hydroxyisobutyrate dehydrogenase
MPAIAQCCNAIAFLTKSGLTRETALSSLSELPVISPAAKLAGNLMLSNRHAPLFPIHLVEKDFRYVVETGKSVNASTPVSQAIQTVYQNAIEQGYGNDNITGVVQLFE